MRSEMDCVEGLSLGNTASLALLQSTYSVLSFLGDSQKARSAASFANLGIAFKRLFVVGLALLPVQTRACQYPQRRLHFFPGTG